MTTWTHRLSDAEWGRFLRTDRQTILLPHFDLQRGDTIEFLDPGGARRDFRNHEVIHVLQNVSGMESGWLVATLSNQRLNERLARAERALDSSRSSRGALFRSNAALKGQITKLRKRIEEQS